MISDSQQNRPANVPQRHANQAMHARYATHARTFFPKRFVSVENKGSKIQLPKLVVRVRFPSPAPVFLSKSQAQFSKVRETLEPSRKRPELTFLAPPVEGLPAHHDFAQAVTIRHPVGVLYRLDQAGRAPDNGSWDSNAG